MSRKNKRAQSEYDRVTYNTREFLRGDKVDNLLKAALVALGKVNSDEGKEVEETQNILTTEVSNESN